MNFYISNGVLKFCVNDVVVPAGHLRIHGLGSRSIAGQVASETTVYSISFGYFWPFFGGGTSRPIAQRVPNARLIMWALMWVKLVPLLLLGQAKWTSLGHLKDT